MKTQIFALAALLFTNAVFAQGPSNTTDFYVGETVTIVAPHYLDDGRVGKTRDARGHRYFGETPVAVAAARGASYL